MARPDDLYGSFGSVPNVQNQGVSDASVRSEATAEGMGAGVGHAIEGVGAQEAQEGEQLQQKFTEAKVNDDYANQYVPAATDLKSKYEQLRGQDKVTGYDDYINGLKDLNKQFTSGQPSVYGQIAMSGLVNSHVAAETQQAKLQLVQSQKEFSDKSTHDLIVANNQMAADNYNNPALIDSIQNQNNNHILLQHLDAGHDPSNPQSQSLIKSAQDASTANMANGMISTAVNAGDLDSANSIRGKYSPIIPGYQKLSIDNLLHTANIQQTSVDTVKALTTGNPVPQAVGAPPSHIQSIVANSAHSSEIDPNNALTVLRIESADGTNTGTRGTLGQDTESAGKSLEEQATTLCKNLKVANQKATDSLGRQAEPWEGYMVYQQGVGGGPALLSALQNNPNAKAVDVLAPLYKDRATAASAISGNGGNISMTVSDFADHIKQVYNDSAARANCNFGTNQTPAATDNAGTATQAAASPGAMIQAPHDTSGSAVQPAASPTQALVNYDKKYPDYINQVNAIPNDEVREGVMKQFNMERQKYVDSANAYKTVLLNQVGQLASNPNFTSLDQIPAELHAALADDHGQSVIYLEKMAQYHVDHQNGVVTKDQREYGTGFYDLFNAIHTPEGQQGAITSVSQLQQFVGKDDKLTIAGYDKLSKELEGKKTPEGNAEGLMKTQFLKNAKAQISNENLGLSIEDPKGEEMYNNFLTHALPAYDAGRAAGKTPTQLLNSDSPDYIGKSIPSFKRPLPQQVADTVIAQPSRWQNFKTNVQAAGATPILPGLKNVANSVLGEEATPEALRQAVLSGKISRADGEAEAMKRGYIRPKETVPMAQ